MAVSNKDWVISIKIKLKEEETRSSNIKTCIYRVPGWLKEHECDGNDKTPYEPEIVSFGPYHRGKEEVKEMEKHKWRCLKTMLQRGEQDVDEYLEEMKKLEAEARGCYQESVKMESNDFAEMLVLDGCFMLEFLKVHKYGLPHLRYSFDDPVFSKTTITHVIARDMIKLENQLPIIVLTKLLEIQDKKPISDNKRIGRLVLRALSSVWVTNEISNKKKLKNMRKAVVSDSKNKLLHCLDIFRSGLLYQPPSTSEIQEQVVDSTRRLSRDSSASILDQEEVHASDLLDVSSTTTTPGSRPVQNGLDELQEQLGQAIELKSFDNHVPSLRSGEFVEQQLMGLDNTKSRNPENQVTNFVGPNSGLQGSEDNVSVSSSEYEPEEQNSETRNLSYLDRVLKRVKMCGWRPQPYYEKIKNNSALMVHCVEDLREAGVKFKSRNCKSFWDLKFDPKNGLLQIPPIKIDDATKTVFLNLIAYEQCHLRDFIEMRITDYVAFMDNLVNSAADVGHLHQTGIIVHQLGSDVEVADLFNRLVKKAFVYWKDGELSNIYEELNMYCTHKRHRWRASWQNEYMKNPWVIISIIAAFFLFGATLLQTFFTVFPYYIPGKS